MALIRPASGFRGERGWSFVPPHVQNVKFFVCVYSDWILFFWQTATFCIPVMSCGSDFCKSCKGAPIVVSRGWGYLRYCLWASKQRDFNRKDSPESTMHNWWNIAVFLHLLPCSRHIHNWWSNMYRILLKFLLLIFFEMIMISWLTNIPLERGCII